MFAFSIMLVEVLLVHLSVLVYSSKPECHDLWQINVTLHHYTNNCTCNSPPTGPPNCANQQNRCSNSDQTKLVIWTQVMWNKWNFKAINQFDVENPVMFISSSPLKDVSIDVLSQDSNCQVDNIYIDFTTNNNISNMIFNGTNTQINVTIHSSANISSCSNETTCIASSYNSDNSFTSTVIAKSSQSDITNFTSTSDITTVRSSIITMTVTTTQLPQDSCTTWISLFSVFTLISLSSCLVLISCCLILIYHKRRDGKNGNLDFPDYPPTVQYITESQDTVIYDHIHNNDNNNINSNSLYQSQNSTSVLIPHNTAAATACTTNKLPYTQKDYNEEDDIPPVVPRRRPLSTTNPSCYEVPSTVMTRNRSSTLLGNQGRPLSEIRYTAQPTSRNRTPSFYEVPVRTLPVVSEDERSFQPQTNQESSVYEVPLSTR